MATVFLAHDLKHDRPVALKVLLPELAARLQHPHILTVHDSGEAFQEETTSAGSATWSE